MTDSEFDPVVDKIRYNRLLEQMEQGRLLSKEEHEFVKWVRRMTGEEDGDEEAGKKRNGKDKKSAKKSAGKKFGVANSLKAATTITGYSMETIKAAQRAGAGYRVFRQNGKVNCDLLVQFLSSRPELVQSSELEADKNWEEARKQRAIRQLKEHEVAEATGKAVPIDDAVRVVTQIGFTIKNKVFNALRSSIQHETYKLGMEPNDALTLRDNVEHQVSRAFEEVSHGDMGHWPCPHCGGKILEGKVVYADDRQADG